MRALVLTFCLALLLVFTGVAQPASDADPRLRAWAAAYLDGRLDEVRTSVEDDLRSGAPHPHARHVWIDVAVKMDGMEGAIAALDRDPMLKGILGTVPEAYRLHERNAYAALLQRFPVAQAGAIEEPWTLYLLAYAAYQMERPMDVAAYGLAALERDPSFFLVAWHLSTNLDDHERARDQVMHAVAPGAALGDTPTGAFLRTALGVRPVGPMAERVAVETWLEAHPGEAQAYRYLGWRFKSQGLWAEAAEAFERARTTYPFWTSTITSAEMLVRAGRHDAARSVLAQHAAVEEDPALEAAADWVDVLRNAGERGAARRVLADAQAQWPDARRLHALRAQLEMDADRHAYAIPHAESAAQTADATVEDRTRWVEALRRAGKPLEAWAAHQHVDSMLATTEAYDEAFFVEGARTLAALDRQDDAIVLLDRALQRFPFSAWLQRERALRLGQMERYAEAVETLTASFDGYRPYSWSIARLRAWMNAAGQDDALARQLEALRVRFSWEEDLWTDAARRGDAEAVWQAAIEAHPDRAWPWTHAVDAQIDRQNWTAARHILTDAESKTSLATLDDRQALRLAYGRLAAAEVEKTGTADSMQVAAALDALGVYFRTGGRDADYYLSRARLLQAQGRAADAAQTYLDAIAQYPDVHPSTFIRPIFEGHGLMAEAGSARVFRLLHHYVERAPYEGERLYQKAYWHSLWGGSPLVALQTFRLLEERAPDAYRQSAEVVDKTYEQVGGYIRAYRRYERYSGIGASERYLTWFEQARLNAQRDDLPVDIALDDDSAAVTITHADGRIERRVDHPVTGRPMLIQVGASFVRAQYDTTGEHLGRVETSAGMRLELDYDESGSIVEMRQAAGDSLLRVLTFTYDPVHGKPSRIALASGASINVAYDAHGEIASVDSPDGSQASMQVTQAFQALQRLVGMFEQRRGTTDLNLPVPDPELDARRAAYRNAGGAASPEASADEALALSRHLIDRLGDQSSHPDAVRDVLRPLLEAAQTPGASESVVEIGVEAVGLWRELLRKTRPQGLNADDWNTWRTLRDWVTRQPSEAAQVLLEQDRSTPLMLLPSGQWLPRSYLSNPGLWHRDRPEALHPDLTPSDLHDVLIRANGDIVVGSRNGLSVLRRGFWEGFGYDQRRGRMVPNPEQFDASSDVLALAEDVRGRLWLGTANGLVLMEGDYTEPVRRWTTPAEGLQVPRVAALVSWGEGVLVGTGQGLRYFTAGGAQTLPAGIDAALEGAEVRLLQTTAPPDQPLQLAADALHVAYSPDGQRLLTTHSSGEIHVWDAATGNRLLTLTGHDDWVRDAVFSPDGTRIVTGSDDGTARVWDATTGEGLVVLSGHDDWVRSVAVTPDGTRVVTGSDDGAARVWSVTGELLHTLPADAGYVLQVDVSPDGTLLLVRGQQDHAQLWALDAGTLHRSLADTTTARPEVRSATFSPDGSRVLTTHWDGVARLWDAATGTLEQSYIAPMVDAPSEAPYRLTITRATVEDAETVRRRGTLDDGPTPIPIDTLHLESPAYAHFDLRSGDFDPVLHLQGPGGVRDEDDDGGEGYNAAIGRELAPGMWVVLASVYGDSGGAYELETRLGRLVSDTRVVEGTIASGAIHPVSIRPGQWFSATLEVEGDDAHMIIESPSGQVGTTSLRAIGDAFFSTEGASEPGTWTIRPGTVGNNPFNRPAVLGAAFLRDGDFVIRWESEEGAPGSLLARYSPAGNGVPADTLFVPGATGPAPVLMANGRHLLVSAGADGIAVVDVPSWTEVRRLSTAGDLQGEGRRAVDPHPTGTHVALAMSDASAEIWDASTGKAARYRLPTPVLVGTRDGLYGGFPGRTLVRLRNEPVEDAFWHANTETLYTLHQQRVQVQGWDGEGHAGTPRPLPGRVVRAQRIHGLASLALDDEQQGVGILTDQGVSVYHADHVEHVDLPATIRDQRAGVMALAHRGRRSAWLTTEGIVTVETQAVQGDAEGRVYAVATAEAWNATFVARGDRLDVVLHDDSTLTPQPFTAIDAEHLAVDAQGRLLANDGATILRYENGPSAPRELFRASPTTAGSYGAGEVTSLRVASDGAVWATAGGSVFRWAERDGVEEFSLFVDSERFPSRAHKISNVVETVEGTIWVVASDESHLSYRGTALEGGVLAWTGDGFRRLDLPDRTAGWFATGYTPIDSTTAILGTTQGFARHAGGRVTLLRATNHPTYTRLRERASMLWLGTRGVELGEGLWLFGTPSGVVAYHHGQWFYPDRLNYLLPDQHLSEYGARMVHALDADAEGRLYIGTDRGLLVYDSRGADPMRFLFQSGRPAEAFRQVEHAKLQAESDRLLAALVDADPETGQLVTRAEQLRQEIERMKAETDGGPSLDPADHDASKAAAPQASGPSLRAALDARERAYRGLMAQLERDNRSLYQMLELKPLDLAALRRDLPAGDVVVQYLPTPERLYIQLVTQQDVQVREVEVSRDSLEMRALRAADALGARRGGRGTRSSARAVAAAQLQADLHWLYEHLLRPVERELSPAAHVLTVPVGALTYVPMGALLRTVEPKREYAVERFTFGILPSMYLLDLALRDVPSWATDVLVVGDPDGTLPGARQEAQAVHRMLQGLSTPLLGSEATTDAVTSRAAEARVVHLATHGVLDPETPEASYLVLASGQRLDVIDAMMLPLKQADLVVLSACETGLGRQGMEYATLARAFAHAGAPSIVATLWRVDDAASQQLMTAFYTAMQSGTDALTALADAQRSLLRGPETLQSPDQWAGYVLFGTP